MFYRKVLPDPLLAPYFEDNDMDRQVAKQTAFLTMALGGPNSYTGAGLRTAHAGLADRHFDQVVGHLAATLHERRGAWLRQARGPGQGSGPGGKSARTAVSEDRSARSHSSTLRSSASR
jgi:globin